MRALLLAALLAPAASRALEVSLEDNRAQRGNIGYVDMQKVFKLFPETVRAKENFEEVVRQAEEQVNIRKAELIRLRAEIAQLKGERDLAAKNSPAPAPPPAPPPAVSTATVAVSTYSVAASTPSLPALSTQTVSGSTFTVAGATTPAARPALPGIPAPVVSTGTAVSTATVAVASTTAPAPPPIAAAALPAANPVVAELDDRIAHKMKWEAQKEEELKVHELEAEKNLLDLEARKTEILLGKIHKAVKAVAKQEGVSVVVDKGSILFGHDAVDLTDKVIKALRGS